MRRFPLARLSPQCYNRFGVTSGGSVRGGGGNVIASIQRLERVARAQLGRLYDGTRQAGGDGLDGVDRRAVERVHELIAPQAGRLGRIRRSGRERVAAIGQTAREDQ
jgi:hypothetical protein